MIEFAGLTRDCRSHPVTITAMPRPWLEQAEYLCEPRDCHANALHVARLLVESQEEPVAIVTGIAREPAGFVYDHSWVRVGSQHYDPTAEFFWPDAARADVKLIAVLERPAHDEPVRTMPLASALYEALTR